MSLGRRGDVLGCEDDQQRRVRIVRRSAQGVWSKPLLGADPKAWVEHFTCGIGDAGQVALAWIEPGRERVLHLAQRPPTGGWTSRPIATAFLPHLVADGTGRALAAWQEWSERGAARHFATSPTFAPAELLRAAEPSLATLAAGAGTSRWAGTADHQPTPGEGAYSPRKSGPMIFCSTAASPM